MHLSAPIYGLKRKARLLSRQQQIPLNEALDRVAAIEGYSSWSLLAAKFAKASTAGKLYAQLRPGDLVLLAARPGHGKTQLSLEVAVEAMKAKKKSVFFSLEYTAKDCQEAINAIGTDISLFETQFEFDGSDAIDSNHIEKKLISAPCGTLAVIDYLQLLDQRRQSPDLMTQVRSLKQFAKKQRVTLIFISQIDRAYDPTTKPLPDLKDVRLPNPLDLNLFDKACFLNDGQLSLKATRV